jgi:hypothetical protein
LFDDVLQNNLHVTVSSLVASAVVWMAGLPSKLNPVILPLMAAVKREQVRHSILMLLNFVLDVSSNGSISFRRKYFRTKLQMHLLSSFLVVLAANLAQTTN